MLLQRLSGDSTLLNFETGRGDFELPFLKDRKISSHQTRPENVHTEN